jgi:hypothetical protein
LALGLLNEGCCSRFIRAVDCRALAPTPTFLPVALQQQPVEKQAGRRIEWQPLASD